MSLEIVRNCTEALGLKIAELGHALDAYEAILYKKLYYQRLVAKNNATHEKLVMINDVLEEYNSGNTISEFRLQQDTHR